MYWTYEVSRNWLTARQNYLTASDMHTVVPYTKGGGVRKDITIRTAMMGLWASKQKEVLESDCVVQGTMARGHCMEPYAIEAYNSLGRDYMYHWDDVLITSNEKPRLAFSPDALNVPMPQNCPTAILMESLPADAVLVEVKSYDPAMHYGCGMTADKVKLEQVWQIATMFAVMPKIKRVDLVLYNPSVRDKMFVLSYGQDDLMSQIKTVERTYEKWCEVTDDLIAKSAERHLDVRSETETNINKMSVAADASPFTFLNPR